MPSSQAPGNRRTHVVIPGQLIEEIDQLVGKRGRSRFLATAAAYELKRQRQMAALKQAAGAWRLRDHPELKGGAVVYQRKLRAEGEGRLKRQGARFARP